MSDWLDGKTEANNEYDSMIAMSGPAITLEVKRSTEQRMREPDRTFSEDALDQLIDSLQMFIGTRLLRVIDQGAIPQHIAVRVHVRIDGREAE